MIANAVASGLPLLARLASAALRDALRGPDGRCPTCRAWPAARVGYDALPGLPAPSRGTPARCPACGWEPVTIQIVYRDGPPLGEGA